MGTHEYMDRSTIRSSKETSKSFHENFYFEITIINTGSNNDIAIGVSSCGPKFRKRRMPGWDDKSIGYFGNNGGICQGGGVPVAFGSKFENGDRVGCQLQEIHVKDSKYHLVIFTKNGKACSSPLYLKGETFYPCVGVNSPGAHIRSEFISNPIDLKGSLSTVVLSLFNICIYIQSMFVCNLYCFYT